MADWAYSDDPAVQKQLDRLNTMSPRRDILGHERLRALLARLGNPEAHLPPVFHVAGTNGKGSTCTYLWKSVQAAGMRAHVYTSPHLVRLNERIRVADRLIDNCKLAEVLEEVLDAVGPEDTTFFEATTAAAFLVFARTPADACIIEVGIGGRLDATNVIPSAIACGIAQLGIDHQIFLGETLEEIAAEKAGIAKFGTPIVTQSYSTGINKKISEVVQKRGANLRVQGIDWDAHQIDGRLVFCDERGEVNLPLPALEGGHQIDNAGLAIAMLRSQTVLAIDDATIATGLVSARWPARMCQLEDGPLKNLLPPGTELWLDGAHNLAAVEAVARHLAPRLSREKRCDVVIGMLKDKDFKSVIQCLSVLNCQIHAVPIAGYDCWAAAEIAESARADGMVAESYSDVASALTAIGQAGVSESSRVVLICGSLYLAGEVLKANNQIPD